MIILRWLRNLLFVLAFVMGIKTAWAARVTTVRSDVAFIKIEGETFELGQILIAYDAQGKAKGALKLVKISGDRAAAKIVKGKVESNWVLKPNPKAGAQAQSQPPQKATAPVQKSRRFSQPAKSHSSSSNTYIGGMAGYFMNSMDIALGAPVNQSISMKGSSFSAHALMDMNVMSSFWFRGIAGYQGFGVTVSDTICGTGANEECKVDIGYIGLGLWGRYVFGESTMRPWVGGGLQLLFPMAKSSTAVSSISSTNTFAGGGGIDIYISPTSYIPVQFEYSMFPSGQDAKASSMGLRFGYATSF